VRAEIRRRADLTLQQVSNITHIRISALSEWERGDRALTEEQVRTIAKVLAEHLGKAPAFLGGPNELFRVLTNPSAVVAA